MPVDAHVRSVVVGTGLVNRAIGADRQYLGGPDHVGIREVGRLLGDGADYGHGPLPRLLEAVSSPEHGVVLLAGPGHGAGDAVVDTVIAAASEAHLVAAPGRGLPWKDLDRLLESGWGEARAFLVVGCHTEHEVAAMACLLRSLCPGARVAVSRHLTGTATPDAHYAVLRHILPLQGVDILLDYDEVTSFLGLAADPFAAFGPGGCPVEPEETCSALGDTRRRIVQSVCMHWTRTRLRPLGGGFSGSSLFIAEGWKGDARTEPMVVKIDSVDQMRRELEGYHQVKDLLGKHVPAFGYPVRQEGLLGVGMELAAMEGHPETLQDTFEAASTDEAYGVFLQRLSRALEMLTERVYRNTRSRSWVVPYRTFGLHAEDQINWLGENTRHILRYLDEMSPGAVGVDVERLVQLLRLVGANPDGTDSDVCVVHGDLNYANIISDAGDNLWFIDWTLSRVAPLEMDFAKLENDVKFVISKDFEVSELDRLRRFEDYLLAGPLPGDVDELPDDLRFARWDLRYRKILSAVRMIRRTVLDLRGDDDWLVYRIALLRYAAHTLSWDLRRGRGECDVPQLAYALHSVEALLLDLVVDDFHLKIRAERAPGYPARLRIPIDEAPWAVPCGGYEPPYHVADAVLAADRTRVPGGWADPEDLSGMVTGGDDGSRRDDLGRPLNPRGRTGIAGRGSLGRWGPNRSVSVVAVRRSPAGSGLDVLLGSRDEGGTLEIPKGFLRDGEPAEEAARRIVDLETGWACPPRLEPPVYEGYIYDPRQTDHAWIETSVYLLEAEQTQRPDGARPGNPFADIGWWPLEASTVNRIPAVQAGLVREGVRRLAGTGRMDQDEAARLLAATG